MAALDKVTLALALACFAFVQTNASGDPTEKLPGVLDLSKSLSLAGSCRDVHDDLIYLAL